jgi:hypothetical protein
MDLLIELGVILVVYTLLMGIINFILIKGLWDEICLLHFLSVVYTI